MATTTYDGSKQQKYYLKNKEIILEKKRAKAAANKAEKNALKAQEHITKMNNSLKIINMGKNIYNNIIDREYFKNH